MSNYQDKHSEIIQIIFDYIGIELVEELHIPGTKNSIDLGSRDFKYGIEIKSGQADFATGYGLNQENFAYGYLLCSWHFSACAIGRLYQKGMFNTGVIVWDGHCYRVIKPAKYNPGSIWEKFSTKEEQEKEYSRFLLENNELTTLLYRREADEELQNVLCVDIPEKWNAGIQKH